MAIELIGAWAILAVALLFGYARALLRGDLQRTAAFAISSVLELPYNANLVHFVLVPILLMILLGLGVEHNAILTARLPLVVLATGGAGTVAYDCVRYPIAHDVATVVMAASGLFFLYQVAASAYDLAAWSLSIALGYAFHFARGTDVPQVRTWHLILSAMHGLCQWSAFFYTVRLTAKND